MNSMSRRPTPRRTRAARRMRTRTKRTTATAPHFEPIVPLPKLVETKMGEEEVQGEQNSGLITHSVLLDLKLYFFVPSFQSGKKLECFMSCGLFPFEKFKYYLLRCCSSTALRCTASTGTTRSGRSAVSGTSRSSTTPPGAPTGSSSGGTRSVPHS